MPNNDANRVSRRDVLKAASALGFPAIVPSTVFGKTAPSNLIQIAQIGCGRISREQDIPETIRHTGVARYVAVCDLDTVRVADGKQFIESYYEKKLGAKSVQVKTYTDYREMLVDKSIDAVCISTPDHWHAQPAMEAALAGKDIYLQKPTSLTIYEGRQMVDTIKRTGRILQLGSQQRSAAQFRLACELVRNGRIGKVQEIYIGLPYDPSGPEEPTMPVPPNLNYEMWLGSTPMIPYTEKRVHPQSPDLKARYDRPGWLRHEQFGAGMITGWGTHHFDIAHWGMGTEFGGPIEMVASAHFPTKGVWNVHGAFHLRARYANGATVYASDKYPNGIKFVGETGWIWVTRGEPVKASDAKMLAAGIRDGEIRLHASPSNDHHLDWLTSIRSRQAPAAPAEVGHRSCTVCLLGHIAMKLDRTLNWDSAKEDFVNDPEASAMLRRTQRAPYGSDRIR